jgi:hypothetical protein
LSAITRHNQVNESTAKGTTTMNFRGNLAASILLLLCLDAALPNAALAQTDQAKASVHATVSPDLKDALLGSWKLVSWFQEDIQTKERFNMFGEHPKGYAIFAPNGRVSFVLTGEGRKIPQTPEDQAAAYRSVVAYSGKYRIEGNKFITSVDVSWDEFRVGTDQVRFFKLDGDHLEIESAPVRAQDQSGRMFRGFLFWEKEK